MTSLETTASTGIEQARAVFCGFLNGFARQLYAVTRRSEVQK